MRSAFLILLLGCALPLIAGDPSPIEDVNVFAESGRNRSDAALLSTTLFLSSGEHYAHELGHEFAAGRHQLSVTLPIFASSSSSSALGDVMLSHRYQLLGDEDSRIALAPRASLVLPTRSESVGEAAAGVQVMLPLSVRIRDGVELHTNAGGTWFEGGRADELNLAQSLVVETGRFTTSLEAAYTRCSDGGELFMFRPGVQVAFDAPGGLRIVPGIAVPLQGEGVLIHVGLERSLSR